MAKEKIINKFKPRDYYARNIDTYHFLRWVGFVLLAISAVASTKFYQYYVFSGLGRYAVHVAFAFSVAVSVVIDVLFVKCLKHYLHTEGADETVERFHFLTVVLAVFLVLNPVADFMGAPELANEIHTAPVNTEGNALQARIDKVDTRITAILDKYAWCAKHKKRHLDCPSTTRLTNAGQIKLKSAQWGHTPAQDKADIKALQDERKEYVSALGVAGESHAQATADHNTRMSRTKGMFRGASLAVTVLYLLIAGWRIRFGVTVAGSAQPEIKTAPKAKPYRPRINTPIKTPALSPIGFGRKEDSPEVQRARGYLDRYPDVVRCLQEGVSVRQTAVQCSVSKSTVQNVSRCMKMLTTTNS